MAYLAWTACQAQMAYLAQTACRGQMVYQAQTACQVLVLDQASEPDRVSALDQESDQVLDQDRALGPDLGLDQDPVFSGCKRSVCKRPCRPVSDSSLWKQHVR